GISGGKEEKSEEASSGNVSETVSEATSEAVSEEKSEENSEEKSEEVSKEEKFMPYAEDKSGYLKNEQTENLNFNSITVKAKDFKGTFNNSRIDENGRLTMELKDDVYVATFESEVMNVGKFSTMLISWNAVCGNGKIAVLVSYEAEDGTWSDYFSYGSWTDKDKGSTSKSVTNDFGKMNVDTFIPSKATTGNIKFKITINRSGDNIPVIENITISTPEMNCASPAEYPESAWVKVPMRSQNAPENGADGGVMCSATTVAMALEYLGCNQTTYETAMGTWDKEFGGYGNWLFSAAEAAAHGYYSFCDFYTEDMMKYALSKGYALGCSTYLTSSGHIVLVVGYETIDGDDYYIVNYPNVKPSEVKVTRYTCEYFNSVWMKDEYNKTGVVYVFQGQY
ncbi:MAG: C39 family peptidase, partial [Clostridia bacterium]|nr:C39 family peptidase [Clostridia bacterium]